MEVILLKEARKDVKTAHEWYEARQTGLGAKFAREVINNLEKLKQRNIEYRKYFSNVQYLKLPVFPFSIFFFREIDAAFIVGVLHNRQNIIKILRQRL